MRAAPARHGRQQTAAAEGRMEGRGVNCQERLTILRRLEWSPLGLCPDCGGYRETGHDAGCGLAALIAEAEADAEPTTPPSP